MPKLIDELGEGTNLIVDYDVREFSGVDRPAMEHAVVAAIKSKENANQKKSGTIYTNERPSEEAINANEEASMSEKENKRTGKETENEAEDMPKSKAKADDAVREAVLKSLPTEQKEFYESANDSMKKEFLEKDFDGRQEILEKEKASREVAYKAKDGTEYLKGDDEKMIEMAKRLDELQEQSEKAAEKMAQEYVEKRVDESYANIAGSRDSKIATVKALDSIADEELRKEAFKTLDFANTAMARAMTTYGSDEAKETGTLKFEGKTKREADEAITKEAQKRAKESGKPFAEELKAVQTENPEVFNLAMKGA